GEVVHIDLAHLLTPDAAGVPKVADQLLFLGIHTDDRPLLAQKSPADTGNVAELLIPPGRLPARQALAIDAQGVPPQAQQPTERRGTQGVAHPQHAANLAQRFVSPLESRDRISGGRILHHGVQLLQQVRPFFSTRFRPPPARRTRSSVVGSRCSISRRPCKMVVRLSPVTRARCWTP